MGTGPTDPLVAVFEMLGGGAEDQHCQPVPPAIHGGVKHPFADGFEAAQIMMFLEQFLEVALLVRIGHGHDFDFSETRRSGVGERRDGRFLTFHTAEGIKSVGGCPAKSALTLFYQPVATFMHTRWHGGRGGRGERKESVDG